MMKPSLFLVIAIPLLMFGQVNSDAKLASERNMIEYAKRIDIHKLDPSLSSERLSIWLQNGPAHLQRVSWHESPTCELKAPLEEDYSVCVRFDFHRGEVSGIGILKIGTRSKGISGHPRLEHLALSKVPYRSGVKLSELPNMIDEASSASK